MKRTNKTGFATEDSMEIRFMRRFNFLMHPILKLPWEFFIFLCFVGLFSGILIHSLDAIFPSIVGGLILSIFYSIKKYSYILLSETNIKIRLGFLAVCEIEYKNIKHVSIVRHSLLCGIGVRVCGRGEVAIVTTTGNIVSIELKERSFLLLFKFIRISFLILRISPQRQSEFIEILKTNTSVTIS